MSQEKKEWDILEFVTQAQKVIENNFKAVLGLFIAVIIGASVWSYTQSVAKEKQQAAFNELYKITKIYNKKKEDFAAAKEQKDKKTDPKASKDKKEEPKKNLVAASGDLSKDYPEVTPQLEEFLKNNQGSNASGEAALILSEIYGEYKQNEKGAEVLSQTLGHWDKKNVLYFVMQMRAGDLWATENNCEKAVPFWQVVADSKSFITRQAQLKLGVCLQEIGRFDEAKKWFTKIKDKEPNSSEGFSAKRYLRFLEFKSKEQDSPS